LEKMGFHVLDWMTTTMMKTTATVTLTMNKAVCPLLVVMVIVLTCLPLVVDSFVPAAVGRHEAWHMLFRSTAVTRASTTSEEWKSYSLNQPIVTTSSPAPFYPKPSVQAGALQQVTTTTPAQQLAQQQQQQQQQQQAAALTTVGPATGMRKERVVLGLPTDEWWNRPLDRERDPVPPYKEWKKFYEDGTLPKRIRGGSFQYENYHSCL
jgi:hypothetical protein